MAVRTVAFGGTDWASGNILYSADLNDTFAAVTTFHDDINKYALAPIGSIIGWKTPLGAATPANWLSCDGSVISDVASPMNGQTLPNLNGSTEATKIFLRGNTTSGGTGGTDTHNHSYTTHYEDPTTNSYHSYSIGSASSIPKYYEIRFIMRVK